MSVLARKSVVVAVSSLFMGWSAGSFADSDVRLVDCGSGASIQDALAKKNPDRELTVIVKGRCSGDVSITRDDVTVEGEGGVDNVAHNIVSGTINIMGARRVVISALTISSPTGDGISGRGNAAFHVNASRVEQNLTNGISVRDGAHATLSGSSFSHNGHATTRPDTGRGIEAVHNGSVDVEESMILNNRSDGVLVANGSYGRLVRNTIEGNGRQAAGEGGVQVVRARVRAHGNVIRNNTGSAAIIVVNHGDYRTGTGLNPVDFPNNESDFERIEHAPNAGLAVDLNNASYADLRQVDIAGSISVGPQSMLQVRGDDIGADIDRRRSTVNTSGGSFSVSCLNGVVRLRFTALAGPRPTPAAPGTNAQIDPAGVPALQCPTPQ